MLCGEENKDSVSSFSSVCILTKDLASFQIILPCIRTIQIKKKKQMNSYRCTGLMYWFQSETKKVRLDFTQFHQLSTLQLIKCHSSVSLSDHDNIPQKHAYSGCNYCILYVCCKWHEGENEPQHRNCSYRLTGNSSNKVIIIVKITRGPLRYN